MKTIAEEKFNRIVKESFHKNLKPLSFKKKANNFYRKLDEVGHIINIQKSMFRSKEEISFTVNIGIFSPIFWFSEFNFKGDIDPPNYPTEPVSIIRKRIGDFIDGFDKWYEVNSSTKEEFISRELTRILNLKIIPFFGQITDNNSLITYLENEYENCNQNYLKFIMYGEMGMKKKLNLIYPLVLEKSNKYARPTIEAKAKKYGLN